MFGSFFAAWNASLRPYLRFCLDHRERFDGHSLFLVKTLCQRSPSSFSWPTSCVHQIYEVTHFMHIFHMIFRHSFHISYRDDVSYLVISYESRSPVLAAFRQIACVKLKRHPFIGAVGNSSRAAFIQNLLESYLAAIEDLMYYTSCTALR